MLTVVAVAMLRQTVLAVGKASHARRVGGGKPDEEAIHRSSSIAGGGFGRRTSNPTSQKLTCFEPPRN